MCMSRIIARKNFLVVDNFNFYRAELYQGKQCGETYAIVEDQVHVKMSHERWSYNEEADWINNET